MAAGVCADFVDGDLGQINGSEGEEGADAHFAFASDLLQPKWSLKVLRILQTEGGCRFGTIASGLPALSNNILTERLRELEAKGLVERSNLPPPASGQVYRLTEVGAELGSVLDAIATWGTVAMARGPSTRTND